MAQTFVQPGRHITVPVDATVKSGDVVKVGELVGVALSDAKTDDAEADTVVYYTTLAVEGVYKVAVTGLSVGDKAEVDGAAVGFATEDSDDEATPVLIVQGL